MRKFITLVMLVSPSYAEIVSEVRLTIDQKNFTSGDSLIEKYRTEHGVTPEMLEALSWLGRGALASGEYDKAEAYAQRTHKLALEQLKKQPLDREKHLPLALGAAIEVQAQVQNARGDKGEALRFLHRELAAYRATSIRTRIQKNINLIDLVGKPAPALVEHEYLGPKPVALATLKGKPVLLFFWAHWCGDCKLERRELSQVRRDFAGNGLVLMGPTQRYGYVAKGEDATPAAELKYIDEIRNKYYLDLSDMPVPISEENLKVYGASTTPTLVLIDKQGIVRMYHPGSMTASELGRAIRAIL